MTFCYHNHFTISGWSRKLNNSSSPCQLQGSENKEQDWTVFFFFLNCCSEPVRKAKLKSCIFVVLLDLHWPKWAIPQFCIAASASPSLSCWSLHDGLVRHSLLYLPKKCLIFSWISSLKQLTTCLHKQHEQHKVRIVWLEARREDVTTSRAETFTKVSTAEATNDIWSVTLQLQNKWKITAPWTSENEFSNSGSPKMS